MAIIVGGTTMMVSVVYFITGTPISDSLGVADGGAIKPWEEKADSLNELMKHKAVFRAAPGFAGSAKNVLCDTDEELSKSGRASKSHFSGSKVMVIFTEGVNFAYWSTCIGKTSNASLSSRFGS